MLKSPLTKSVVPEITAGRAVGRTKGIARFVARHYVLTVCVATMVLYLVTWPANRTEADDGYTYAYSVENGVDLVNPRHVLNLSLMRALFLIGRALHPDLRAHTVMTVASLVFAVSTVCLVAWMIRRQFHRSAGAAIAGAAVLATSYGFWRYATEAEVYALASLLATGAVALTFWAARPSGMTVAAVVGAAAMLVHTGNVVPVLAAVPLGLWRRRGPRVAFAYGVGAGGLFLATAAGVLVAAGEGASKVAERSAYTDLSVYPKSIVGAAQSVVSGNFLFAIPWSQASLQRVFPSRSFAEEIFAGDHAPAFVMYAAPVTAALAVLTILAVGVIAFVARRRQVMPHATRGLGLAVGVWFGGMAVMAVAVSGGSPEGWLLSLPPGAIAVGAWLLPRIRHVSRAAVVALPLVLLAHNLVGGMLVIQSPDGDYNHAATEWILEEARADDVVLTSANWVTFGYLKYHTDAEVVSAFRLTPDELSAFIEQADARRVFVTDDVVDPPLWLRIVYADRVARTAREVARFQHRLYLRHNGELIDVYQVR